MPRTGSWKDRLGKGNLAGLSQNRPGDLFFAPSSGAFTDLFSRRIARVLLALVLVTILFCGWFPFDFSFGRVLYELRYRFDWSLGQYYWAGDTTENLIFFMPLGFVLGLFMRRKLWNWVGNFLMVLVLGGLTSFTIEVGQVYLGSRDPSITDVINNTLGTGIGYGIYLGVGPFAARCLEQWRKSKAWRFVLPAYVIACLALAALICIAPYELGKNAGDLSGWRPNYPLAMGQEPGAQRGWPGYVERAMVASRAADESQVEALLDQKLPAAKVFGAEALQANYDLHGEGPFVDAAGKQPPLAIVTPPPRPLRSGEPATEPPASNPAAAPVNVWEDHYLRTMQPVESLNRAIIASNEFTLLITASATRQDPVAEARILTISQGAYRRNLTLAQERQHLLIRLRTETTSENGDRPQYFVHDVFADNRTRTILVTYKDSQLSVYIDNAATRYFTRFTPEAATIFRMYPRTTGWAFFMNSDDVNKQSIVYRGLSFFLLSIFIAITVNTIKRPSRATRIAILVTGLLLTMAGLEVMMMLAAKQPLHIRGIAAGVVTSVIGALIVGVDQRDEVIRVKREMGEG